jgi:hypothetical protein
VSWLSGLAAAAFLPRRSGCDAAPACVGFLADRVALGHFFLEYLGFRLSVSLSLPVNCAYQDRWTMPGNFEISALSDMGGTLDIKVILRGALVEWYWQRKTEVLREKSVTLVQVFSEYVSSAV